MTKKVLKRVALGVGHETHVRLVQSQKYEVRKVRGQTAQVFKHLDEVEAQKPDLSPASLDHLDDWLRATARLDMLGDSWNAVIGRSELIKFANTIRGLRIGSA